MTSAKRKVSVYLHAWEPSFAPFSSLHCKISILVHKHIIINFYRNIFSMVWRYIFYSIKLRRTFSITISASPIVYTIQSLWEELCKHNMWILSIQAPIYFFQNQFHWRPWWRCQLFGPRCTKLYKDQTLLKVISI